MTIKTVPLSKILKIERRPVELELDKLYQEIGIFSHGKGIFHKEPRFGYEVGDKKLFQIKKGDFIFQITFAWEGAIALTSESEEGLFGSTRFPTFRIDESICDPKYLLLYFKTKAGLHQIGKISPGSAGRNRVLSLKRISEIVIPLPPLKEQQRIVVTLERLMMKIGEVRRQRIDAITRTEEFLMSSMNFIFNRLFNEYEKWEVERFCKVVRGGSPRPAGSPLYYGGEIPFLKVGDLTKDNSKTVFTYSETLKESGLNKSRLVDANTLMLTNSGATLGVPKICTIKACFNDGIQAFLDISNDIDKEYLYYFFFSKTKWFRDWAARGQGQPNLNTEMVKKMIVPIPPLSEQRRIVAHLDRLQAKVDEVKRLQAETERDMVALVPAVLAKAFGNSYEGQ